MEQIRKCESCAEMYRKGYQEGYDKAFSLQMKIRAAELNTKPTLIVSKEEAVNLLKEKE